MAQYLTFADRILARGPMWTLPFLLAASLIRYILRLFCLFRLRLIYGVRVGDQTFIGRRIRFVYPHCISIGKACVIGEGTRFWCEINGASLKIEDGAEIGRDSVIDFSGGLTIGTDTLISENVLVYTHDHGYDPRSKPSATPLAIGKNVWIGARAIILPSVSSIGDRAIVGAGAIVANDIPENHVCVAAKARVFMKKIPSDGQIASKQSNLANNKSQL